MSDIINQIPSLESKTLWSGFYRSALGFPARPALEVNGQTLTYEQLKDKAASLAATLAKHSLSIDPPLTAIFAYRSATAFAGVLGSLFKGHGYVPLNRTFPSHRTRVMLERSRCRSLIIDSQSESQMDEVLAGAKDQLLLIFPEKEDAKDLAKRWPRHIVLGKSDLEPAASWSPPSGNSTTAIAYLLFTSGSTGAPKGVMVSHRNVRHYIDWAVNRYSVTEKDRVSQTFDMTFDLSVHDMFVAWECGACVCCPSQKAMIKPGRFIKEARLSIWFSVPSTAVFMKRFGELKPGLYPDLRLSIFCGEALPVDVAKTWSSASPNSIVENVYGPTELTIACTAYRWDDARSPAECEQGTVPIGEPFEGMDALVVDEQLHEVHPDTDGELLMTGPQLSLGYWEDNEKTARVFVVPPGKSQIYYRTGDRVRRPLNGKPMVYLGRMDNQLKILGHRVELGEIEAVIREESGVDGVVAVGWPVTPSGADGVEVFLQADNLDTKALLDEIKSKLPTYMVPQTIHLLPQFPLNVNGKYDRKALIKILEDVR